MNIIPLAFAALLSFAVSAQDYTTGIYFLDNDCNVELTETGTADVTWVDRGGWVRHTEETMYRVVWVISADSPRVVHSNPRDAGKWSYPRIPRNAKILEVANVRAVSISGKELTE